MDKIVKMRNVGKFFGEVVALEGLDLDIDSGEVVGLVGDNGAGKSTLVKILSGVHTPDEGEAYIKGKKIESDYSVSKARKLGVETVFQEGALGEKHSLWRNIFAGREPTNAFGYIDVEKAKKEAQKIMSETMGFAGAGVSPDTPVATLSGGERQGVAITRALYFNADLLILDEPIASLSLKESEKVLDFVREVKEQGTTCIFVSHEIARTYPVADRLVVLDRGRKIKEVRKEEISRDTIIDDLIKIAKSGEELSKESS